MAKIALSADYSSGVVQGRFGDPTFDVPTTIARAQNSFFLVNAQFTTTPTPSTEYWITETRIRLLTTKQSAGRRDSSYSRRFFVPGPSRGT